jgi:hypothetical protein
MTRLHAMPSDPLADMSGAAPIQGDSFTDPQTVSEFDRDGCTFTPISPFPQRMKLTRRENVRNSAPLTTLPNQLDWVVPHRNKLIPLRMGEQTREYVANPLLAWVRERLPFLLTL